MFLKNAQVRFDDIAIGSVKTRVAVPSPPNRCWVTSLTTAIGPMAREEARRAMSGPSLLAVLALSHLLETFAHLTRIDEAVYPEHRLLTTSLYHGKMPALLDGAGELARHYPGRAIVLRSLTKVPQGVVWPFRLVWIVDDPVRDWTPRTDTRRDLQLLSESGLVPKAYGADIDEARLVCCLTLYRALYLDTYSAFNPDYEIAGLRRLMAEDGLEIHTLESEGEIVAFCGLYADEETITLPMMGYDRNRPQGEGIYRMIQAHMAGLAAQRGLKLNLSAGAPHFKRHRGAKPWMEYLLIIDTHLPLWRRMGYRGIAWILRVLEPQLAKIAGS